MKKLNILYFIAVLALVASSCRKDDPVDKDNSIFQPTDPATITAFDNWLIKNIAYPYNIDILYKYTDINTDPRFILVPADIEKSQTAIQVLKYAWLEAYDEVLGVDFTRQYAPKQFMFVGSSAIEGDNTKVMATAEGGVKITMYEVNKLELDPDKLIDNYFHVIHHEFSHILHQTKNYSTDYQKISDTDYIKDDWWTVSVEDARKKGFVSPYSMVEANEDFAEVYSIFITSSDADWKAILSQAGIEGAAKINKKLDIIREYAKNSWGFNLDQLRAVVLRRADRVISLNFEEFN
ncbi:MAG: putative zinc-binding metallopeptidase [Sphingobacterium hotanense]